MAFAFPPGRWTNQDLELYHGTTLKAANAIASRGIALALCSPLTDFGQGFYTTTLQRQAITWAYTRAAIVGGSPAYLSYRVNRDALSRLETLFSCEAALMPMTTGVSYFTVDQVILDTDLEDPYFFIMLWLDRSQRSGSSGLLSGMLIRQVSTRNQQ